MKIGLNVGAAVLSGDVSYSVETGNRRSERDSYIFMGRGAATRPEKL
jgi:hypothetical protein